MLILKKYIVKRHFKKENEQSKLTEYVNTIIPILVNYFTNSYVKFYCIYCSFFYTTAILFLYLIINLLMCWFSNKK